ncbi:MAG: FeoB-associated Cys-rich membrane protein [Lachnospiraceae bacterium]|jgi:hypothetical protein|nr:FeoB-associated Cys-rich membrane protein [Lachnospiraceae bacterium]
MINWIVENAASLIAGAVVLLLVVLSIRNLMPRKGKGSSCAGCGGGCAGCSGGCAGCAFHK